MRALPSVVLSGVLASLLLTGTAAAVTEQLRPAPTGKIALMSNPIYKTGRLELRTCPERQVHDGDRKSVERYLASVLTCLNKSWKRQFAKARLPFAVAKLRIVNRSGADTGCGSTFPKDAQAIYCWTTKTLVFLLDKNVLTDTSNLYLFEAIAHEYGHHVQWLSGIMEASYLRTYRTPQQRDSWRRFELQADCLSGAFLGSVWLSLERPESDFVDLRSMATDLPTHGKAANYSYWLNRGFQAKGPGACNTFAARSRVS